MMGWYHHDLSWGGWLLMSVAMIAFWALVITAVITLFRSTEPTTAHWSNPPAPDPIQVLQGRLAAGELTTEEYRDLLAALTGPPGPGMPAATRAGTDVR